MDAKVKKEMVIADMLQIDPGIAAVLMASGMHCVGCPSAQGESLEEAAIVHGLDADELVANVNGYLAKKQEVISFMEKAYKCIFTTEGENRGQEKTGCW